MGGGCHMCNGTSPNTNKVPKEKPDRQVAIIIVCAACALKIKRGGGSVGKFGAQEPAQHVHRCLILESPTTFGNKSTTSAVSAVGRLSISELVSSMKSM